MPGQGDGRSASSQRLATIGADLGQAELAAHLLRVDTFPIHLKRLNRNGAVAERWRLCITAADQRQLRELVDVAERRLGHGLRGGRLGGLATSDAAPEAVLQGVTKFPRDRCACRGSVTARCEPGLFDAQLLKHSCGGVGPICARSRCALR